MTTILTSFTRKMRLLQGKDAAPPTPPARPALLGMTPLFRVRDIKRSLAFYRDALGFQPVTAEDLWIDQGEVRWARLTSGPVSIMLFQGNARDIADWPRPGAEQIEIYLYAADVAALHEALTARGYQPSAVRLVRPGAVGFDLRDPDGCRIIVEGPTPAAAANRTG